MSLDVFISYARRDGSSLALRLAQGLRAAGLKVFWDQDSILPGENWERTLDDALEAATHILVILTPFSVKSEEVEAEWRPMLNKGKNVLPLMYLECEIPRRLSMRQFIDFQNESQFQISLSELVAALNSFTPTVIQSSDGLAGRELYERAKMYAENGMEAQAVRDFLVLLQEDDERSRRSATRWIGKIKPPGAENILSAALQREQSTVVQVSILEALDRVLYYKADEIITLDLPADVMTSSDAEVRQAFIKLLGTLHDPNFIPHLVKTLIDDPAPEVRWQAVLSLSKFAKSDPRALKAIEDAKKDTAPDVQRAATRALDILNVD